MARNADWFAGGGNFSWPVGGLHLPRDVKIVSGNDSIQQEVVAN
jgi:hypothetical protein